VETGSGILARLITACIQKLSNVGLSVRCVVCDQAATNISALEQLGFSESNPVLEVVQVSQPVNVVFVPHLMKNVRNNFSKYDIDIGGKVCSWKFVRRTS